MKILIYPHDLDMGGSQLNAIELAGAVRDLGHDVSIYGRPGSLMSRIEQLGLTFIESPEPGRRPSRRVAADLRARVRAEGYDVIHGYEWPPALEARIACQASGTVAVATVMSMAVAPFIPRVMPLTVGTDQIAAAERLAGRREVSVIEPPVDVHLNQPGIRTDVETFRRDHDIPLGLHLVVVGRLATELKLEGLLTAISVVPRLASDTVLTIVGDGPSRAVVEAAADEANRRAGRRAVVLTGELEDPRTAYEMADIALGMGGSALRAMAFAKPLVVQGEQGFWATLTPDTLADFRWTGWYGVGAGPATGAERLTTQLSPLLADGALRDELGAFSRHIVVSSFSLEAAASAQVEIYRRAVDAQSFGGLHPAADVVALVDLARYKVARVTSRLRRIRARDDFNSSPVAATGPRRVTLSANGTAPARLAYLAGMPWDGSEGTDRRLVTALARRTPVLWVDPPAPLIDRRTGRLRPLRSLLRARAVPVAPGIHRLEVVGPPFPTRFGLRRLANAMSSHQVHSAVKRLGGVDAVVVANPLAGFPRVAGATRIYYVTDDWPAGSTLMGVSRRAIEAFEANNAAVADQRLAVSPALAARVGATHRVPVDVLANGCTVAEPLAAVSQRPTDGVVGLTGQINERLDLDLLEAVADRDLRLVLVGPRKERDAAFRGRVDRLVARANVTWLGEVPSELLPEILSGFAVGLTPYTASAFNLASFPIKTLDYLAAGLACVATPSPALEWLDTDLVLTASGAEEFADTVELAARTQPGPQTRTPRIDFARGHTWSARADQLLASLGGGTNDSSPRPHDTQLTTQPEGY
ncbi:MAG: glycosyltransferase [Lapillicoccus sp.]